MSKVGKLGFQPQHYKAIAAVIAHLSTFDHTISMPYGKRQGPPVQVLAVTRQELIDNLSLVFALDNPLFEPEYWKEACDAPTEG